MVPYDKVTLLCLLHASATTLLITLHYLQPKEALQMLNTFLGKGGAAL